MKLIFKVFKLLTLTLLTIIVLGVIGGWLFIKFSPQFGGEIPDDRKSYFETLDYYKDGKFFNLHNVEMSMSFKKGLEVMSDFLSKDPDRQPGEIIKPEKLSRDEVLNFTDSLTRLVWFGHSAFLLEIKGKKILLDPMLGQVAAPHPWLGSKRYSRELPLSIEDMPVIDAIVISHDHYDHLDYESIIKLKEKVNFFYVPLGVGEHLKAWGIAPDKIRELKWWESTRSDDISFICTPSQHFSGRGLFDRAHTLWASWVIKTATETIYFSGDGGYGDHFKDIGNRYGPFDIAMIECGQYNLNWKAIHMMPEESARAAVDLNAKLMIPIHWGAFTLALHDWTDPVNRVIAEAKKLNQPIATPRIGQPLILNQPFKSSDWWLQWK